MPSSLPSHITAGERTLPLKVRRIKQSRRMSLRVNPLKDEITLTLPLCCPVREARRFLDEKQVWLDAQARHLPERIPLTFGNTIPVLGEPKRITPAQDVDKDDNHLLPVLATPARCETTVTRMLKTHLHAYLSEATSEMARTLGCEVISLRLADPSGRWGSCGADGKLMFSWRLVFAPKEVLDYVAAHEVAHLREHNHSPAFWALVRELCPDYRQHREWLKTHGATLTRYGRA